MILHSRKAQKAPERLAVAALLKIFLWGEAKLAALPQNPISGCRPGALWVSSFSPLGLATENPIMYC